MKTRRVVEYNVGGMMEIELSDGVLPLHVENCQEDTHKGFILGQLKGINLRHSHQNVTSQKCKLWDLSHMTVKCLDLLILVLTISCFPMRFRPCRHYHHVSILSFLHKIM